jgi:hypothetical protein
MKATIKISMIALMTMSIAQAEVRYDVKSAKIEFETKSTQKVGSFSIVETGTKKVLIDNYGERELIEVNKVQKRGSDVEKIHTLRYINGTVAYGVQFKEKKINRMEGYMGDVFGIIKSNGTNEEMLKKMKFKKAGTDKVAGQTCDIWKYGKSMTKCIYKGFPLREETTMMGMKSTVVATKVELDVELSRDDFKLPDFPINGKKYTQAQLEEMDKKEKNIAGERKKEQGNAMALMAEAFKKAGVKEGKSPTKEQMKKAKEYMQSAMFPMQKKKFLEEAKGIDEAKKCLTKAKNIKEANSCEPDEDRYDMWNDEIKKETLEELSMFENKILPCVKKATNGKMMEQCFPKYDN